jgi:hypothetical protein
MPENEIKNENHQTQIHAWLCLTWALISVKLTAKGSTFATT